MFCKEFVRRLGINVFILMNRKILIVLFCAISLHFYGQNGLPFSTNKQLYVKGNSALIGNNIVSTNAKKPYNKNAINDILKLKYIDVDTDKNTFSSSQATLNISQKKPKIKYAALYWSAIYKYDLGFTKTIQLKDHNSALKKIIYKGNNKRSSDVNSILFKTPNSDYIPISGQIIFDSYDKEGVFDEIKPYVCYADVTSILQSSNQINGDYTLANMKATQGLVSGGASGGWLLYIIYEEENTKPKYFTTYNGFQDVYKEPVKIHFQDFKAPETGEIKTSLLIGALEGDQKFKTDNCAFLDYKNQEYIPLFNKIRPKLNFFNSSISINESLYTDRLPNSRNTLGFDLLKIEIPNKNNSIISHNTNNATVQFKSKADRFYLFFVAFETEINPVYLEGKQNKKSVLVLNKNSEKDEDLKKIRELKSISIPALEKGYYLVTNVFSIKDNATKWMAFLREKGFDPKYYINPENKWFYIYLNTSIDPNVVYEKHKALSTLVYFEDIWILKINFLN